MVWATLVKRPHSWSFIELILYLCEGTNNVRRFVTLELTLRELTLLPQKAPPTREMKCINILMDFK